MNKHCVRILGAAFGLAALAVTVRSQTVDQVVVNIPYEFVVAGKTLPPGNYKVNRASQIDEKELVISSFENRVNVFVLSTAVDNKIGYEAPVVDFQQVGEQHLLTKIETAEHVFTIPVAHSAGLESAPKKRNHASVADISDNR
jgi:hypothetical protein